MNTDQVQNWARRSLLKDIALFDDMMDCTTKPIDRQRLKAERQRLVRLLRELDGDPVDEDTQPIEPIAPDAA